MFKRIILTVVSIFLLTTSIFSWSGEAVKNGVNVYKNKKIGLNEKPLATLEAGDVVNVLSSAGSKWKVKTIDGQVGYVEKKSIRKVKDVGKTISMSGEDILGDLGDIEAVYIFEDDDSKLKGLKLERSFKDEMKAPIDKEHLERKNDEYVKW